VVWATSYLLGCSWVQCESIKDVHSTDLHNSFFTVCFYGPTYVIAYTCTLYVYSIIILFTLTRVAGVRPGFHDPS